MDSSFLRLMAEFKVMSNCDHRRLGHGLQSSHQSDGKGAIYAQSGDLSFVDGFVEDSTCLDDGL